MGRTLRKLSQKKKKVLNKKGIRSNLFPCLCLIALIIDYDSMGAGLQCNGSRTIIIIITKQGVLPHLGLGAVVSPDGRRIMGPWRGHDSAPR
jgi:hypothetical protein